MEHRVVQSGVETLLKLEGLVESLPQLSIDDTLVLRQLSATDNGVTITVETLTTGSAETLDLQRQEVVYLVANPKVEIFRREAEASAIEEIIFLENSNSIVLQIGGPFEDLALVTRSGELITKSVKDSNPEFERFSVSFREQTAVNEFGVNLGNVANEGGIATINAETGQIIPGSPKLGTWDEGELILN